MQHTKEDIQLLYKYLVQYLIKYKNLTESKAKKLAKQWMKENDDKLYEKGNLAYIVAKHSIEYFCLHYLQNIFVAKCDNTARQLADLHFELWNELQQMVVDDKWDKEEFILPRGSSKSTTINKALTTFMHCFELSKYSLIIGKTKQDASDFLEDVKKFLEFPQITETFGKLVNKRDRTVNQQEFELDNDTMIRSYGWETSIRGTSYSAPDGIFRPTTITCDDILNENDIKTDGAKERAINKFYKEIAKAGDSEVIRNGKKIKMATKFIILGTPLAQDCFINTIRQDPTFRVFRRSVVDFDMDEYFEENNYWQQYKKILFNPKLTDDERKIMLQDYYLDNIDKMKFNTIWNDKYKCNELMNDFLTKKTAFLQELMCDCENVGEKWFKSNRTQSKKEIEDNIFTKTILTIDPAGIKSASSRRDYFAFAVLSEAANGFKYVRLGEIEKIDSYNYYIDHVVEILNDFTDITHVIIEKNFYNGLDGEKIKERIKEDDELNGRNIEVECIATRKNKDERISTIVDDVNNGRIIFCKDRVQKEAIQQLMDFQGQMYSLHDDFADCIALGSNEISNIIILQKPIILNRKLLF